LDGLLLLVPPQSVAFWGLLVAFTAAYNIKVLVSGYQSIDMYFIVLPVKFGGGMYISVQRYKQLFTKNGDQKVRILKKLKTFENSSVLNFNLLVQIALFLNTKTDNVPSNFA
jgi:hypothetical protein